MKKIFSFLFLILQIFAPKIAFAGSSFDGKFKILYGVPNTAAKKDNLSFSIVNVSEGHKFSVDSDQSDLRTGQFFVQTQKAMDFMEITEFSPKISGFGPFNAILTTGLKREEKKVVDNCTVTYVVGSNIDPKYSDEISVMNLMGHGAGPSKLGSPTGKDFLDTHHSFHLNSADSKTDKFTRNLKNPYYIKSLKVSCNKPVLTGFSPRLDTYYERNSAPAKPTAITTDKNAEARK